MAKTFLGVGWSFPVGADGAIRKAEYEESVRQAIWIVLGTAKGERLMRPDFGCAIHDFVFERNTRATAGRMAEAVQDALLRHEPRIELVNVDVDGDGTGNVMHVSIEYRVRATNNVFNLVFPFYLEQSASR